ncbi:MAG: hypothetical protein HONDAALG_01207 [Gammaproteobacteria bacterium]|nr:hypothetical protein [Gammaproteobacteria bacterium]
MSTGYMRWGTWAAVSTADAADAPSQSTATSAEVNDEIDESGHETDGAQTDATPEGLVAPSVNSADLGR